MIERTDSQQTTCNAMATIDGERRQVATATCTLRPGKSLIVSIDWLNDAAVEAEDIQQIGRMFKDYLEDELKKARALGIPV